MKHLLLPDGRNFAWRASGSGAPLILIHGWGNSAAIFSELMTQLSGCHCFAPDLPGYGTSTATERIDLAALADDFIRWFDALGLETVTLLGWSLGGMLAQELAARFPARIERLILVATTPRFVVAPNWQFGLADSAVRALARDFKRAPDPTLENFWRRQFHGEGSIPSPRLPQVEPATALAGLELLRQVDLREKLPRITVPTLVLHGSTDVIIPIAAGRFIAATLPQARFYEVSGCGHAPFLSAVERVSAAIRQFLP